MKCSANFCILLLFLCCQSIWADTSSCNSLLAKVVEFFPGTNLPLNYQRIDRILASEAMRLIQQSYAKSGGSKYQDPVALTKDLTHSYIARNSSGELSVFLGARMTEFGQKITILATDESMSSKVRAGLWFNQLVIEENAYGELSGASLSGIAKLLGDVPIVSLDRVQGILSPYAIRKPTSEEMATAIREKQIPNQEVFISNAYVREIPVNGVIQPFVKVLVGKPKLLNKH